MKANEILKEIEEMSNGDRIKLLEKMYYKYFDNRPMEEVIEKVEAYDIWGDENEYRVT